MHSLRSLSLCGRIEDLILIRLLLLVKGCRLRPKLIEQAGFCKLDTQGAGSLSREVSLSAILREQPHLAGIFCKRDTRGTASLSREVSVSAILGEQPHSAGRFL